MKIFISEMYALCEREKEKLSELEGEIFLLLIFLFFLSITHARAHEKNIIIAKNNPFFGTYTKSSFDLW